MSNSVPGATDVTAYYRAALACLQFVEARRPSKRRFGAEADARWRAFRGHLSASDRLNLLIRDANAEWPGAFGARNVFADDTAAEDDAFGASWPSLDPVEGEALWRELAMASPSGLAGRELMETLANTWGLALHTMSFETADPVEQLVLVGPSAVAAALEDFLRRPELDWAAQVTCLATLPAHRQLALAAGAVLDARGPTRVFAAHNFAGPPRGARVVVAEDAAAADVAAARRDW